MLLRRLWLTDFRNYESASLEPAPGLTAVIGGNGQGKTNLLEAIAWLATLASFRGAPPDSLVRRGATMAVLRAELDDASDGVGRNALVEAELVPGGRNRVQVNRQRLRRARDLLGTLRVTVFSPDDLALVKGGPGERRRWLDDALVALHARYDELGSVVDRILRQRNALLRQSGGRQTAEIASTLDVWDERLAREGEALAAARESLVERLEPVVAKAYAQVADEPVDVSASYERSWRGELADALAEARADELRRGVTLVGPHRDEVALALGGLPARTHASQGEQRSLALALRLATHEVITTSAGSSPVLLLDDVFSELDPVRSRALVAHLPAGQALLTTAGELPEGARPDHTVRISGGRIVE